MNDYFEEMNIDYSELNDYEDIETYYDKIKDYTNLVSELQSDRVESQKYIVRANKRINQLQSNWNSLREFVEYQLKHNVGSSIDNSIINHVYQEVRDKMNELERNEIE